MYTRILIPLDGSELSEHVLPYATILGKALDCPIELLRIPEHRLLYTGDFESIPSTYEAVSEEDRIAESQEYLDNIAESLREKDLIVSTVVRNGMAAHKIVNEAAAGENTLVAMASHGRSGVARWVMGSVADEVLRKSNSPLLLVRPRHDSEAPVDAPVTRIIAPVDGSTLAEQTLAYVAGLAKALGVRVDLVRVTPSPSEYYRQAPLRPAEGYPVNYSTSYQKTSKDMDSEAQSYLEQTKAALEGQGVSDVENHLVHGHPAAVISDMARSDPASLVVIATHGRSGIGRWVLGSVADSVVRHSGCPVLLIRAREDT